MSNQLIKKNRIVRNYNVFTNTLWKQEKKELPMSMFFLGNKDSGFEVTIFTSMYCRACKEMHEIVKKIIFAYEDKIKINLFFKTQSIEEKNHCLYLIHSVFLFHGNKEFLKALSFWFENENLELWEMANEYNLEERKDAFKHSNEWLSQNGILTTPSVFINGYLYPSEFEKEDLYYYIEGIVENNN